MKQKQVIQTPKSANKTPKSANKTKVVKMSVTPIKFGKGPVVKKKAIVAKKAINKKPVNVPKFIEAEDPSVEDELNQEGENSDGNEEKVDDVEEEKIDDGVKVDDDEEQVDDEKQVDDEEDEKVEDDEEEDVDDEEEEKVDDGEEENGDAEGESARQDEDAVDEDDEDEKLEADDEEPTETAIDKEEPTIPSKVKSGEIPKSVPWDRIIRISKLPKKCKQIDIVEAFAKYGAIDQVHIFVTTTGTVANVAFKTDKAAIAASAANKRVKVNGLVVEVSLKKLRKEKFDDKEYCDRTVVVKYLKRNTNEDQIREHFESCGEIERINIVSKDFSTFAFITFADASSIKPAKKLHNSVLNNCNISVYEKTLDAGNKIIYRDPKLTIMLKNKQQIEGVEGSKLESIFAKCGEIDKMDVLCKRNILAFISFKTEQAAQKALKLNGKTEEGIELEIEKYNPDKTKTTIYVSNLHNATTEEDLRNLFSKAGEISSIILKNKYAIIVFKDSNAYCKSFLLNESYIKNQLIFVEPHSPRKQYFMKSKQSNTFKRKDRKRPFKNGNGVFASKKAKTN